MLAQGLERYKMIAKVPMDFGIGQLLNPSEIHMVSNICMQGEITVTELARQGGVTKGAVSQIVAKLEKKGLIQREPAPKNQSKLIITATELGKRAHDAHLAFHEAHDQDFLSYLSSLSAHDYQVFKEFCSRFHEWMHSYEV